MPPTFPSTPYRSLNPNSIEAWYRRALKTHPFLVFGLPFLATIVGSSFLLTPATALRYERHDRRVKSVTREEALNMGMPGDGGDEVARDVAALAGGWTTPPGDGPPGPPEGGSSEGKGYARRRPRKVFDLNEEYYRLAAKDIDNWTQKRVKRLPGERDGKL